MPKDTKSTRREMYKGSNLVYIEPENHFSWLIEYANEIGLYVNGNPISWQEINSWMEATNNKDPWLATVIRKLAIDYSNELFEASDPSRPSPVENIEEQRKMVSMQFHNFLRSKT